MSSDPDAPNERAVSDHVRLHRRSVRLDGEQFTTLSLRPAASPRFGTGRDESGWWIESDGDGAGQLAQLCWAVALQRHTNSLVVIDHAGLRDEPDGSSPIVIVNGDLGVPSDVGFAELASILPWTAHSQGTVKLITRGLGREVSSGGLQRRRADPQRWLVAVAGLVVLSAPEAALRDRAVALARIAAARGAAGAGAGAVGAAASEFRVV